MKHKKLIFILLLVVTTGIFAEDNYGFTFTSGVNQTEKASGIDGGSLSKWNDDGIDDGSVLAFFTGLAYDINEDWTVDYKYSYEYTGDSGKVHKRRREYDEKARSNTARLIRYFDPIEVYGYNWYSTVWVGIRNYRDTYMIKDNGHENWYSETSNRFLFNANTNAYITKDTLIDLNYHYQFRKYESSSYTNDQHRHYLTLGIEHDLEKDLYLYLGNTLYIRDEKDSSANYGEWGYELTLGHDYHIKNDIYLTTELTIWGEVKLWENGSSNTWDYNKGEILLMPLLNKKFFLQNDIDIYVFGGAGYVYRYDTKNMKKKYSGLEIKAGVVLTHRF